MESAGAEESRDFAQLCAVRLNDKKGRARPRIGGGFALRPDGNDATSVHFLE
jgi:hypothetical protein